MSTRHLFAPDRSRVMPGSLAARLDEIHTCLDTLRGEQRRFERLGFERPQARCHEEIRYWRFLAAIHSLPPGADPGAHHGGPSCPARPGL